MKFILLAGVNGAGKSTIVDKRPDLFNGLKIINPDQIQKEQGISIFEAGKETIRQTKALISDKKDFSVETTLSSQQPINVLKEAKKAGYETEIIYVVIEDIDTSKKRIADRVVRGGHDIPEEAINRRYNKSFNNLIKAAEHANRITIYDNSKLDHEKILTIENKQLLVHNNIPDYLKSTLEKLENQTLTRKELTMSENNEPKYKQNKNAYTNLEATGVVTGVYKNENSYKLTMRTGQAKNEDGSYKPEQNLSIVVPNSEETKALYDQLDNQEVVKNDMIKVSAQEAKNLETNKTSVFAKNTEANIIAKEGENITQKVNMGVTFNKQAIVNHVAHKETKSGNQYAQALLSDNSTVVLNEKLAKKFKDGELNKGDAVEFSGKRNVRFVNREGEIKKYMSYNSNKADLKMTAEEIKKRAQEKTNQKQEASKETATKTKTTTTKAKKTKARTQ